MKKCLLSLFGFLFICQLGAQQRDTSYWHGSGVAGVSLSQVSLSNWAAGGDGSIAFDLMFNYGLDYKRDKHLWQNRLELAYGMNKTQTNGTRKTNDKIYLSSTYGYKISKRWYASANMTFNTQFANGYDYSITDGHYISQFMSPGYLSLGLGFTWHPRDWFTATFLPVTWRGTFVMSDYLSDLGAYGVDRGKHLLNELGGNIKLEAKYEFLPNMTIQSRLDLFSNYLEKAQNVDVRWDNMLSMKINKWFSANLSLNMIYDDDTKITDKNGRTGARFQIKEVLGVGLQAHF